MSRHEPRVFVARKSVDVLLAGEPSRYQLVCRISAIRRLAEDCERFLTALAGVRPFFGVS